MARYSVNRSNWDDASFWSGISESTEGHELDFSAMPPHFLVEIDQPLGQITISDGTRAFTIGEAGATGVDANLGGTTQLAYFTEFSGGRGADHVIGPDANSPQSGPYFLEGRDGNDTLSGTSGDDTLDGGNHDDVLSGGLGNDDLRAHTGDDEVTGGDGDDTITGSVGADTLYGNAGADLIDGGTSDDLIYGGVEDTASNTLTGGDGHDVIFGGRGDDTIHGERGHDTIDGGAGDDLITGEADRDLILGEAGNDTIDVGGGNDTLSGGQGADHLLGGADHDVIWGGAGDFVDGGETGGDMDTLNVSDVARIDYATAESGTVFFNTGDTLTFQNVEHVNILSNNHVVEGTAGDDQIDSFYVDADGDWIDNGDAPGGGEADLVRAGAGHDAVWADEGDDTLYGEDGDDTLHGQSGADALHGGVGDDRLSGGTGDDTLHGGTGDDVLDGGAGSDTFVYTAGDGLDTITDFDFAPQDAPSGTGANTGVSAGTNTGDKIDLSAFYDTLDELTADYADDGILNQSNDGAGGVDYSDNASFGGGGIVFQNTTPGGNTGPGGSGGSGGFTADNTGIMCFTAGTFILTDTGARPIETVQVGDRIVTRDNGLQTLRWLGRRALRPADLHHRPKLRPIVLAPHLTGAEAPLIVSPQHGVVLPLNGEEVLIRAVHLARLKGGAARVMQGCQCVCYIHLMFDSHQIVFANGAPSESFFPGKIALSALSSAARAEILTLFPEIRHASAPHSQAPHAYGPTARRFARFAHLPKHLAQLAPNRCARIYPSARLTG